jgi:hypothetical protein
MYVGKPLLPLDLLNALNFFTDLVRIYAEAWTVVPRFCYSESPGYSFFWIQPLK